MNWREHPLLLRGGAMSSAEYRAMATVLAGRAPCRLLVFGAGHDSELWLAINAGGATFFIEDDPAWAVGIPNLVMVQYHTRVEDWEWWLAPEQTGRLDLALPAVVGHTQWDVILVDAPKGYEPGRPGRMQSIYAAGQLACRRPAADVFVHDCDRHVERVCCDRFLASGQLVATVERLRHYQLGT